MIKDRDLRQGWHISVHLSFLVKNFYCVINCLNMNRVTIYRAKCLAIMALKSFTDKLLPLWLIKTEEKHATFRSENKAKQS